MWVMDVLDVGIGLPFNQKMLYSVAVALYSSLKRDPYYILLQVPQLYCSAILN